MWPLGLAALLLALSGVEGLAQEKPSEKDIQALLARFCVDCHGGAKPKADLNLEASVVPRRTWKKIHDMLHADEMPPPEKPRPTPAERERITDWARDVLARPSIGGRRDPGPAVIRRLNRIEYNNTVFDLFRVFKRPRGQNIYYDPAKGGMPDTLRIRPDSYQPTVMVSLPTDDVAHGYSTIGEALSLPPFLLERYLRAAAEVTDKCRDALQGMFDKAKGASDGDKARALLASLAARAWRRPVAPAEVDRLFGFFEQAARDGETPLNAVKVAVQAILVAPDFLYKVEKDGPDDDPRAVRPLRDYELATRLSYFLWSSMPDDELFRLAADGKLRDPAVLEAQARRLLRSAKSIELADVFAMQWLKLEALDAVMPDPVLFPAFYIGDTSKAMRIEAALFFETVMAEDRSILEFIDADWSYLNPLLARVYGISPGGTKGDWKRITLPDKNRGGVITLAGVLAVTSSATRSNPVKRGTWLLETILGAPPPPPIAGAGTIPDEPTAADGPSVRQKLERHRADPRCASCHKRIDPLGFALENYDPIGVWREKDGIAPVDALGTLPDGTTFNGPAELKRLILTKYKSDFVRCLTEHLMTYALGRKVDYYDDPSVREIVREVEKDGYRFSRLIVEIVKSYPFRHRRNREAHDE
ncbi:MAG TPA: DUF1592 domain-containing protein [Planctomycetota bacterium]